MKTIFILLLTCFIVVSWTDQEIVTAKEIELQENKIYTIPEGKKWKIDVSILNKLSFCKDTDCGEELHFFKSVAKKAKARSTKIEGTVTLPAGLTIKTQPSEKPIIVHELALIKD